MIMKMPLKTACLVALVALSVSADARSHRKHKEHKHALELKVSQLEGQVAELEKALAEARKLPVGAGGAQNEIEKSGSDDAVQKQQSQVALQERAKESREKRSLSTLEGTKKPDQIVAADVNLGGNSLSKEAPVAIKLTEDEPIGVSEVVARPETWVMQETEPALYRQITSLIGQKDYVRAESCAQNYIKKFSEEKNAATVLFWLGEMKMLFGDLKEARGYYHQSLSLLKGKGRTPEVLLKISMIAYQKGDNAEGDLYYNKLQDVYPGSTASHMARAQRKKYRTE